MNIRERGYKKTYVKLTLISFALIGILTLSQAAYIRDLLFLQTKNTVVPQRLLASINQLDNVDTNAEPQKNNFFDCKNRITNKLSNLQNSIRFQLKNCPSSVTVRNLTNGAEATIYETKNGLTTDFLGLKKGRNRILFEYGQEKVDIVVNTSLD